MLFPPKSPASQRQQAVWVTDVLKDHAFKTDDDKVYCKRESSDEVDWVARDKFDDRYPVLTSTGYENASLTGHLLQSPLRGMRVYWDMRCVQELALSSEAIDCVFLQAR